MSGEIESSVHFFICIFKFSDCKPCSLKARWCHKEHFEVGNKIPMISLF